MKGVSPWRTGREIRRLHRTQSLPIKMIAVGSGLSRNTVRTASASTWRPDISPQAILEILPLPDGDREAATAAGIPIISATEPIATASITPSAGCRRCTWPGRDAGDSVWSLWTTPRCRRSATHAGKVPGRPRSQWASPCRSIRRSAHATPSRPWASRRRTLRVAHHPTPQVRAPRPVSSDIIELVERESVAPPRV